MFWVVIIASTAVVLLIVDVIIFINLERRTKGETEYVSSYSSDIEEKFDILKQIIDSPDTLIVYYPYGVFVGTDEKTNYNMVYLYYSSDKPEPNYVRDIYVNTPQKDYAFQLDELCKLPKRICKALDDAKSRSIYVYLEDEDDYGDDENDYGGDGDGNNCPIASA